MKKHLLILVFTLLSVLGFAQQQTVSGRVTATGDGAALPGVSVTVKGTIVGITTDADGRYSLRIPNESVLLFSSIGFDTQEIALGKQATIDVQLVATSRTLGEVQVVGSRNASRTRLDSPVPVDVIDIKSLQESAPLDSYPRSVSAQTAFFSLCQSVLCGHRPRMPVKTRRKNTA